MITVGSNGREATFNGDSWQEAGAKSMAFCYLASLPDLDCLLDDDPIRVASFCRGFIKRYLGRDEFNGPTSILTEWFWYESGFPGEIPSGERLWALELGAATAEALAAGDQVKSDSLVGMLSSTTERYH